MKFASDLPGYAQGHRFANTPEFYDGAKERFHDLAGYNRFGMYVKKAVGSPVFNLRGVNARQGLYMDNTNQWSFPYACPWHGSGLMVLEVDTPTGAVAANMYPLIFGSSDLSNITNDAQLLVQYYFGNRRIMVWGASSQATSAFDAVPNTTLMVIAWSRNQQDRMWRKTQDGTITAEGPYNPALTNGNAISMGGQPRVRLGNINGDKTSSALSTTGTMHAFEQHFWKGDVLRDNPAELKAFIDTLKSHYGIA